MEPPKVEAHTSVAHPGFLSRLRSGEWRRKPAVPPERGVSPEYHAGFLSLLTFQWINPLMMVCRLFNLQILSR